MSEGGEDMTEHEKIVLTAYTGVMVVDDFSEFQRYADEKLGFSTTTIDFARREVWDALKEACRDDFLEVMRA